MSGTGCARSLEAVSDMCGLAERSARSRRYLGSAVPRRAADEEARDHCLWCGSWDRQSSRPPFFGGDEQRGYCRTADERGGPARSITSLIERRRATGRASHSFAFRSPGPVPLPARRQVEGRGRGFPPVWSSCPFPWSCSCSCACGRSCGCACACTATGPLAPTAPEWDRGCYRGVFYVCQLMTVSRAHPESVGVASMSAPWPCMSTGI